MDKESRSYRFGLDRQNALVSITDVSVHHAVEADEDGRIRQHVWIEGSAEPRADCDSMSVDLELVLWDEDDRLGACSRREPGLEGEGTPRAFKADSDLRIAQNAKVSKMELNMEVRALHRFAAVELKPETVGAGRRAPGGSLD